MSDATSNAMSAGRSDARATTSIAPRACYPLRVRLALPRMSRTARSARIALAVAGLGLLSLYPGRAAADLYSFTDKDGVIHFTNKPKAGYKLAIKGASDRATGQGRAAAITAVMPGDKSPERFTRYDTWIRQAAALYRIPEALVRAVIKCESDYDPRAVSHAGAHGLMQLMPETALRMQVRDIFDPRENIFGGTRFLRVLANHFNGSLELTIAGYNAGETAVMRHGGIPPFAETQAYVTRVLTYYQRYRTSDDPMIASMGD
jgi:soluble lytic murein transglycosylase-like protein